MTMRKKNPAEQQTAACKVDRHEYGVVQKGLLTFLGFFYSMRSFSPCWAPTEYIRASTYSLGLFAGLFSDAMGYCLPIVSWEMTRTKWLGLRDHIRSS